MIEIDFSNERYVRAFVRDTSSYLMLPWEARGLYWELRRKADRSGLIPNEDGLEGISVLIRWPIEVVERAMPELFRRGFVVDDGRGYLLPQFMESEEAKQSDKLRARESRARRSTRHGATAAADTRDAGDDNRDDPREQVTKSSTTVTKGDAVDRGRSETSLRAVPYQPVPSVPSPDERRSRYEVAKSVFQFMEAERRSVDPNARGTAQIDCEDKIVRLLGMGHTEDDLMHVVRVYAYEARQKPPHERMRWFQAATMWQPDNVERAKNSSAGAPAGAPADGLRAGGSKPVRAPDADEHAKRRIAELDAEAAARARGAR